MGTSHFSRAPPNSFYHLSNPESYCARKLKSENCEFTVGRYIIIVKLINPEKNCEEYSEDLRGSPFVIISSLSALSILTPYTPASMSSRVLSPK